MLPHPPQRSPYRSAEPEGFVLSVNRLDRAKRIDLLIAAAKAQPDLRVVIAGEGPDRERLEQLAGGLNGQVEFAGRVDDARLVDLYARCLAVYYAPIDEDFGMVPYEAFLSAKPVDHDARRGRSARGGARPRNRSRRRARGRRARPAPAAISRRHVDDAKVWGRAGQAVAERVTWDACVDALWRDT